LALLQVAKEAQVVLEKTVNERTLELQQATALAEQASHARGQFFTTINHEMRTPLNGILGMVEMLQRKPSATEQEQQLIHLSSASQQLAGLIDEVLDFSKIDENLIVLQHEAFSVHTLMHDLSGLFLLSAKQKNISFSIQVEAHVGEWLLGDMPRVKQVLTNLIGNAIKFTEHGKVRLIISSSQPTPTENHSKGRKNGQSNLITFEVSDTGCGIEHAQLEHIFLPYYQHQTQINASALPVAKDNCVGTGLGLAISEGLTKAMGGSIIVTSHLGHGSHFSLTLPLPTVNASDIDQHNITDVPETAERALDSFTGINILLVEDSSINQNVITTFLEKTGANISICDTGTSAIEHFKEHGVDLILMDYRLPDINGLVVSQNIRSYEHQTGSPICPIVMHTADNWSGLSDQAQSVGIGQLLPKPFTQMQLINAISQALDINSRCTSSPLRPNTDPVLMHLFDDFVNQNIATVRLCTDYLTARNFKALSHELHKCVGNAGLFGANELSQTVLRIQKNLISEPYDTEAINSLLIQADQQLIGYRLWFSDQP